MKYLWFFLGVIAITLVRFEAGTGVPEWVTAVVVGFWLAWTSDQLFDKRKKEGDR